jgi:hypothetical protein
MISQHQRFTTIQGYSQVKTEVTQKGQGQLTKVTSEIPDLGREIGMASAVHR